ncbi:MAG: hypothetical protein A2048_07165 [Deltaproteobacteria bacterium GWA2_45_12]|nr:MAG: hypothetical protein A2048_07165 [Deltaproteobacteria bacterium GWA2_45_12]
MRFAKNLRKQSTDTENWLWNALRAKRFEQLKFRRQQIIGNYIVDFVCFKKRVIIECDGSQHLDQIEKDQQRDEWLKKEGYQVLRFWDYQVLQDLDIVLEVIFQVCQDHPPPNPLPSREGGY